MNYAIPSPLHRLHTGSVIDYELPLKTKNEDRAESVLVGRLKDEDPEALRDVYGLYSRPVFSLLLRMMNDRAAAEDVQQQVFMEVWQKAGSFNSERGTLLSWVMTIARSRAIDALRRRVPEPRDPEGTTRIIDSRQPAQDEIDEALESWRVTELLGRLPRDEADLLKYRFQGELSQSEIAETTGIPLGTVKSRMVSGLERLRLMMEAEDE